ncbi:rapid alkalinization factor [Aegilops tauschii subsp. strangulata]|nr:rapid alkalinization factor [Aegilops tauschii subsp. strangulata]
MAAKAPALAALLLLAAAALLLARGAEAGAGEVPLSWELGVEDVADDGYGLTGGDAVARRVLQSGNGYISYGALRRDNVPCSVRGSSYYNCRPGGQANPYSRGCSAITRCRG